MPVRANPIVVVMRFVTIVAAVATLVVDSAAAQSDRPAIRLTEVLRIDGAKEDLAGTSAYFWHGPGGRVALFDSPMARYVFFDSTGRRIGTFGAQGYGPGEFAPSMVAPLAGNFYTLQSGVVADTMWVYSTPHRRFTLVTPDFKLNRTFQLPLPPAGIITFRPMALLEGDRVLGRAVFGREVPVTLPNGRATRTYEYGDSAIVVAARDGSVERRLAPIPPDSLIATIARPGQGTLFAPVPFRVGAIPTHTPNGDRIAFLTSTPTSPTGSAFRLTVVRTTGETVFSRTYPYTPLEITKRMADSAYASMELMYGRGARPGTTELLQLIRDRMPSVLPPFRGMSISNDGHVWLRRNVIGSAPDAFLVIGPDGDFLGEATLPKHGMVFRGGSGSAVWATETDADGFVRLIRFRVEYR